MIDALSFAGRYREYPQWGHPSFSSDLRFSDRAPLRTAARTSDESTKLPANATSLLSLSLQLNSATSKADLSYKYIAVLNQV
jgi:hypothetical protein